MATKNSANDKQANFKLEVVVIGVSDIDRAKAFYEKLGWRLDADFANGNFRAVQVTPHNSPCAIIFGKGITAPKPGALQSLTLVVEDINAAREELIANGVKASKVFTFAAGPYNDTGEPPRTDGRDAEGRSYYSFVSFEDPDGNGWLLQEITARLPGREWKSSGTGGTSIATLAELLHDTEQHHGAYEKTHGKHNWWDWYAPYLDARLKGDNPEKAAATADQYMAKL